MSGQKKKVGTGITARDMIEYDGDDVEGFKNIAEGWNEKIKRGGGDYGAITVDMADHLQDVLDKAGSKPFDSDSMEDFADRILAYHRIARKQVEEGNADHAARFAFLAGYNYSQAVMKFNWEKEALVGANAKAGREKANERAREKNDELYKMFEDLRKQFPKDILKATYNRLSDRIGLEPDLVGKRIRRHKSQKRKAANGK